MKANREEILALRVAIQAARKAWVAIEPFYGGTFEIHEKADGPCTTADRLADQIITEELKAVFPEPEYGYLSEETKDTRRRLDRERVWIIDPIDGTNDFIEQTGQFCIQIGLARRWRGRYRTVAGLVYGPPQGKIYWALRGMGAFVENVDGSGRPKRLKVSRRREMKSLRAVMSRSHMSADLKALIDSLQVANAVRRGSVGLKVCALASGEADFYVSTAIDKTKEWDSCGPEMIMTESGGRMTDLRGVELPYNGRDVRHRHAFLASNGLCHDALVDGIRRHFADPDVPAPKHLRERLAE